MGNWANQYGSASDKSVHRKVIHCIHENWNDGSPFAINEIQKASAVSRQSVIRTVVRLVELNYIMHTKQAYRGRHYRVSTRWVFDDKIIQDYELARAMLPPVR